MNHRHEIDGLRAVAIIPVILFHAGVPGFAGGYAGVDIFFVISGYLITGIIAAQLATGTFSAAEFYERRARRILPALLPVLIAATAGAWALFTPDDFRRHAQSLVATALFASNFLFAMKSDYFYSHEGFTPLLHGWSLAVEEQFYLAFPLALWLIWRLRPRALLPAVLALLGASLALAALAAPMMPQLAFFMLPTRLWELMAGAACALLPSRPAPRGLPALAGLGLIAAGFIWIERETPAPGLMFLLPVAGTALALLFAAPANLAGRVLTWRPFVFIGLISYGIYLWHQPLLAFAHYAWFGETPPALTALVLVAALALGALSWRFVERPLRERRVLAGTRPFVLACLGAFGLALAVGVAGHLRVAAPRSAEVAARLGAVYAGASAQPVIVPRRDSLPFVLLGDSHARQYYPALAERLGEGAMISRHGCLSLPGMTNWPPGTSWAAPCEAIFGELTALARQRDVRTVIWAQRWDRSLWQTAAGVEAGETSGTGKAAFLAALGRAADALPPGSRLVLVGNVPTAWAAGPQMWNGYLRCRAYVNTTCPTAIPAHMAEGRAVNRILAAFARTRPRVSFVDPAMVLCPGGRCIILAGGVLHYNDGSHLTPPAARLVAAAIAHGMSAPLAMDRPAP